MNLYIIIPISIIIVLIADLIINIKSYNTFFALKEKGIIFNNYIFMHIDRTRKKEIKNLNKQERIILFRKSIDSFYDDFPKNVILKTNTHETFLNRLKNGEKEGKVKIIKCKEKKIKKSMFLQKLHLKKYNNIFERRKFYYIKFRLLE